MKGALRVAGCLAIGLVSTSTGVHAQAMNTKVLFGLCTSDPGSPFDTTCSTYILGYIDAVGVISAQAGLPGWCLPEYFSAREVKSIFVRYLRNMPALQDVPQADAVLWTALKNEFPCPKKLN